MLEVDVFNFLRHIHCDIRLNLAYALIPVQVGLLAVIQEMKIGFQQAVS